MQLLFLRHSLTIGNLEHRYIGCRTDEPLCSEGIILIDRQASILQKYKPDLLFVSPMLRCRETAARLFPNIAQKIVPDFRECDFGQFEGKNYLELSGNVAYQAWIDSGGTLPFPGGESREAFLYRTCKAISTIVQENTVDTIAIIAHGGTMMSILSVYEIQKKDYFDWNIPHCTPFLCEVLKKNPLQLRWKEMK